MSNDYSKREPTKNEKMIYELFMNQQQMEKGLWSTSTVTMAIAILTNTDPEEVAKLMLDDQKIKDYSSKVNEAIKKLEAEKAPKEEKAE